MSPLTRFVCVNNDRGTWRQTRDLFWLSSAYRWPIEAVQLCSSQLASLRPKQTKAEFYTSRQNVVRWFLSLCHHVVVMFLNEWTYLKLLLHSGKVITVVFLTLLIATKFKREMSLGWICNTQPI